MIRLYLEDLLCWYLKMVRSLIPEKVRTVVKTSDQEIISDITVADDDELFISLLANKRYLLKFDIIYEGDALGDIRFAFSVPAGSTGQHGSVAANGQITFNLTSVDGYNAGGATVEEHAYITVWITTSATAGNITLQWAQITSNAVATKVLEKSVLLVREIGEA